MKPPPFTYHDPQSLDEAYGMLATLENARVLSGGQSLLPMLNFRYVQPDHIIDVAAIMAIQGIEFKNDTLKIGAMTRQRDIEFSEIVARRFCRSATARRVTAAPSAVRWRTWTRRPNCR